MAKDRKRLGERLIDRGFLTAAQLEGALKMQESRAAERPLLGTILVEQRTVSGEAIRGVVIEELEELLEDPDVDRFFAGLAQMALESLKGRPTVSQDGILAILERCRGLEEEYVRLLDSIGNLERIRPSEIVKQQIQKNLDRRAAIHRAIANLRADIESLK